MATSRDFLGKGVLRAVENVNTEIAEAIIGLDAEEQAFIIDRTLIELDGTENKSRPGRQRHAGGVDGRGQGRRGRDRPAAVSLLRRFQPDGDPVPMMNVSTAASTPNDSLVIRSGCRHAGEHDQLREALRCGAKIFHHLKKMVEA